MVLTILFIQPWAAITLTIGTICIIITVLLCCACWKQKKATPKFYILDESGLRTSNMSEFAQNSLNNLKVFRRLSTSKDNKIEAIFTSNNLPLYKTGSDSDLMDSVDTLKSFQNSTLQLEDGNSQCTSKEEMLSCISSESQYTFYSTHPALKRSNSRATFVSVDFDTDTEKLIY